MKRIFLTFDIEDWSHANFHSYKGDAEGVSNLDEEIDKLVDICSLVDVKATCFVLGSLAETKPYLIKKLYTAGHEIASHGYNHKLVYNMTPGEFKDDLEKSCNLLEDITGEKVSGFRAPSWSIKKDVSDWYYDIISESGLTYSSSIYPAYTYLYGITGAVKEPHIVKSANGHVLEIPVPVTQIFGKDIGFTGGFYLRLLPLWFIKKRLDYYKYDSFIYLHPREINPNQPKMRLNFLENVIAYYGIKDCEKKLVHILEHCKPEINGKMREYANTRLRLS